MSVSAVEICNRALNAIGQASITALDEGTPRAVICNRLYEDLRDELLQDHPWNFATARASLAASVTEPAFEWDFQYPFPAAAIRILAVNEDYKRTNWVSEGRNILTDYESPIFIRYTTNAVTEDQFTPKFTSALVLRIAMDLAMPLTESMARREALGKEFMTAIRAARGADAREDAIREMKSEYLIDARR